MITLYGIANCDTMKKAFAWLDQHGIAYRFHDYRKAGLDRTLLLGWEAEVGWEALLNRRGMLWRKLDQARRDTLDRASAIELMLEMPGIIRRPLLDNGSARQIGFSPEQYARLFVDSASRAQQ